MGEPPGSAYRRSPNPQLHFGEVIPITCWANAARHPKENPAQSMLGVLQVVASA